MNENELTKEDMISLLTDLNRMQLERRSYIQKYYKLRKLHSEVVDSMLKYMTSSKYSIEESLNKVMPSVSKEINYTYKKLDINDEDDGNILAELLIYKNHPYLQSVTEIYMEKQKFKSKSKIKMLECINNSYVGLFKVIKTDAKEGYITLEDVFTKKTFKVIDVALSSSFKVENNPTLYTYNRIITYDNISYTTGIHCIMSSNNKKLMKFIDTHKYNECSDFSRCLMLYKISKQKQDVSVVFNHNF